MREEYYRSWVLGLGSWVLSFGSWVLSWILDPGSWTLFESTIPMYLFPVKIPDYHPANCGSGSGSGSDHQDVATYTSLCSYLRCFIRI